MKLVIGADHAGVAVKEELKKLLRGLGHDVADVGTAGAEPVDYPDFAERVARAVAAGEAERGILVCGTGNGMAIAANKVPGVRAAVVTDVSSAELSRRHNDANVYCAGARLTAPETISTSLKVWLETPFDGGRHARRVEKIRRLEAR